MCTKLLDKLSNATYKIEVKNGLTDNECKELFAKVLNQPISKLPNEAIDLHRLCKQNPFVISVIASNLKQYKSNDTRWLYWKEILESNQSTNFEPLRKPIEESLKDLKNHDPQSYKSFEELVIFTDNVNVPVTVCRLACTIISLIALIYNRFFFRCPQRLAEYWNVPLPEAERVVLRLDSLYLLQASFLDGIMYCSLHYLYYSYLNNNVNPTRKQNLHGRLVSSYRYLNQIV